MKAEICIDVSFEMRVKIQFKTTFTNYTKTNILRERLPLLAVDWDKNALPFTKQLHLMNKIIGYSN